MRFSRFNIFARDGNTCQYCHKKLPRTELNLDHVIPRSRGGMSTWENIVCSCHHCNRRKGGRTPDEAGMHLFRRPRRPEWTPFSSEMFSLRRYREWMPSLSQVDSAYWNTELIEILIACAAGSGGDPCTQYQSQSRAQVPLEPTSNRDEVPASFPFLSLGAGSPLPRRRGTRAGFHIQSYAGIWIRSHAQ